jgi:methyl-accepting chemotaxis protein
MMKQLNCQRSFVVTTEAITRSKEAMIKAKKGWLPSRTLRPNNSCIRSITSMVNSVDQVGQMANSVSDIAGQTNMLALNAAIEAARAGEAGRDLLLLPMP